MHFAEALVFAATASGAALSSRQTQICDGAREPSIQDCQILLAVWTTTPTDSTTIPDGSECYVAEDQAHGLNCILSGCDVSGTGGSFLNQDAIDAYNIIQGECITAQEAGGAELTADGVHQIQAFNDPNFKPPSSKRATPDIQVKGMSKAKLNKLLEKASSAPSRKRQESGDNSATVSSVSANVEAPNSRQQITAELPAGSSYTTTTTDTKTTGISSSFGLEAGFFDIFTASADITVSTDYSISSTTGVTVDVQCENGQQGIVYWAPLFDWFQGTFEPSGDAFSVYIPIADTAGAYDVDCLG